MFKLFLLCGVAAVILSGTAFCAEPQDSTLAKPVTIVRVDMDGSTIQPWIIQVLHDRIVWDAIGSTGGWVEVDGGLNKTVGAWSLQALAGLVFTQDENHVATTLVVPQLYALRFTPFHGEAWITQSIPLQKGAGRTWNVRTLASAPLVGLIMLGFQYDDTYSTGTLPVHNLGPLVEMNVSTATRLSLTVQKTVGASRSQAPTQSRFLLTSTVVF